MNALIVVLIGVLAAVSASPASKMKESVMESRTRLTKMLEKSSATGSARTKSAQNALRRHNAQSTTYVNLMMYEETSCDNLEFEVSYGTGMCFMVSLSEPTASSGMFSYSNNVLTTMLYSDTACSTYAGNFTVVNANGISQNTCTDGVEWSTSTSFSEPSSAGFSFNYFTSESTCTTATSPFYAYWSGYVGLDDGEIDDAVVTLDDDLFNCLALSADIDSFDDTTVGYAFTTGTYYSTVFTSSGSSSSKSSCFAGSETVELASGETIAISEVKMGDRVLGADANGNTKFSEVIAVPHARNAESAVFTHLKTASGNDIKMTPEHLVMVSKACDSATELVQAGEVASGMCLMTTSGMDGVKSTSEVTSKGVYTVVLQDSEMVVVNGVVASPFAVNHATANAYYNVIRALPASVMSLPLLKQANLVFGSIVASMGF